MARYIGPVCKLCRRENMKLYLKGERCFSEKCAQTRRPYPPGQHGQGRVKLTEYGLRLREKQKVRRVYGVLERQFEKYFATAARIIGSIGENMLASLERRLDNVVHRMGFASTRSEARQLVKHNHVLVNGKRLNIPSYVVLVGDKVEIKESSRKIPAVVSSLASADKKPMLSWLEVDKGNFSGVLKSLPVREELNEPAIKEQYIVEYYSRLAETKPSSSNSLLFGFLRFFWFLNTGALPRAPVFYHLLQILRLFVTKAGDGGRDGSTLSPGPRHQLKPPRPRNKKGQCYVAKYDHDQPQLA